MQLTVVATRAVAGYATVYDVRFDKPVDAAWVGELIEKSTELSFVDASSNGRRLTLGIHDCEAWAEEWSCALNVIARFFR